MTVKKIFTANNMYDVEGNGYAPEGPLLYEGKRLGEVLSFPLQETLLAGLLCNDSRLIQEENLWRIEGDPTEGALITVARKSRPYTG